MRELTNVGKFEPKDNHELFKSLERELIKIQTEAFLKNGGTIKTIPIQQRKADEKMHRKYYDKNGCAEQRRRRAIAFKKEGLTLDQIAAKMKLSTQTVERYIGGHSWNP